MVFKENDPNEEKERKKCNDTKNYFTFLGILIIVIISWILIELWGTVLKNFVYGTLGLDENSTVHTLIVALTVSIIFLIILAFIEDEGENLKSKIMPIDKADIFQKHDIV